MAKPLEVEMTKSAPQSRRWLIIYSKTYLSLEYILYLPKLRPIRLYLISSSHPKLYCMRQSRRVLWGGGHCNGCRRGNRRKVQNLISNNLVPWKCKRYCCPHCNLRRWPEHSTLNVYTLNIIYYECDNRGRAWPQGKVSICAKR